jgi:hypothetical protein
MKISAKMTAAIILIIAVSVSALLLLFNPEKGCCGRINGWLFKIDVNGQDEYYMVASPELYPAGTVFSKSEIEEKTGASILPIDTATELKEDEIQKFKAKAEEEVNKVFFYLEEDRIEETKEPLLQFNLIGGKTKPQYYVVPVIGNKYYYLVHFAPYAMENIKAGEIMMTSKLSKQNTNTTAFFDLLVNNGAETIIEDYLNKNNLQGTIKEKYYVFYTT